MSSPSTDTLIKPMTPGELAIRYGVTVKTLRSWLRRHQEKIGLRDSIYVTARQVSLIYQCIGSPEREHTDL